MSKGDQIYGNSEYEDSEWIDLAGEYVAELNKVPSYTWFNALQGKLNEAGLYIDLNDPESAARLIVIDTEKRPENEEEKQETEEQDKFILHFAMKPDNPNDPKNSVKIDFNTEVIGEPENFRRQYEKDLPDILKGCKAGGLNLDDIENLYQKARNGRLMVIPSELLDDGIAGLRQIYVGEDGLPVIGKRALEFDGAEKIIYENCEPRKEPVPEPGIEELAKTGDISARTKLSIYQARLAQYENWKKAEELGLENPEVRDRILHLQKSESNLINGAHSQSAGFFTAVVKISDASFFKPLSEQMSSEEYPTAIEKRSVGSFGRIKHEVGIQKNMGNPEVTEKILDAIADSMICHIETKRMKALNGASQGSASVMNEKQYQKQKQVFLNSRLFRLGVKKIGFKEVQKMTEDCKDKDVFIQKFVTKANASVNKADSEAPEINLSTIRDRYDAIYQNLKNDDSILNWNNSRQYKELLEAFRDAAPYLKVEDGKKMSPEDSEAMREHLVKIAKKAENYRVHIGAKGKNERQERRRLITDELLELSDSLVNPDAGEKDVRWKTVSEKYAGNVLRNQSDVNEKKSEKSLS